MLTFNTDFMTETYRMEYDYGLINADKLAEYVRQGILSKEGYKTILGVDYEETALQPQS